MKKVLLSVLGMVSAVILSAQTYQYVDINQIRFVSQQDLQNCNDSSAYLGDTVTTRGIVIVDGNLSEVGSGSIQGGSRPFISVVDTSYNGGPSGPFQSCVVMGAFNNIPSTAIENAFAGDILEMDVVVDEFNGLIQLTPVSATAVSVVGLTAPPSYTTISAGDIQDQNRQNILPTGEQWDGSYVELQNMTVVSTSVFSGGSRCEFTVADANGNQVLVADRFLPMVVQGVSTVNPGSPDTVGSLVPPTPGTVYNHIRGLIFQDENGCAGGGNFAGGYEMNPFLFTDIDKAASPASITNVQRNPLTPNASQSVTVSADIIDNDGIVTGATLYYTADLNAPANLFQSISMTNTSGSEYSATIPSFPLDSVVRYYIEATDDSSNISVFPSSSYSFYTVRPNGTTIMDVQMVLDVSADDESPLVGDTVTVTGIVTASYQTGDLGYLYIQDPTASEFAGVFIEGGPTSVFGLNRNDEVTITGIVEEQFGFTKIQALSATPTSNTGSITPIPVDPSDSLAYSINPDTVEYYEGMLVRLENPTPGKQLVVTNPNLGFGEYAVGSSAGTNTTARILAGRQQGTQAQSSLNVSYISDTSAYGANLNVTPIQVTAGMTADFIEGLVYYSFGNHKLTPRNNNDFGNVIVSLKELEEKERYDFNIYPNPANERAIVQIDENLKFDLLTIEVFDMQGRRVIRNQTTVAQTSLNLEGLDKGIYLVKMSTRGQELNTSKLIIE